MANIQIQRLKGDIAYSHNGVLLLCTNKSTGWLVTNGAVDRSKARQMLKAIKAAKAKSGLNQLYLVGEGHCDETEGVVLSGESKEVSVGISEQDLITN